MKKQKHLLQEYGFRLDQLTVRVENYEKIDGSGDDVMALKADIISLRMSIDTTSLWGTVEVPPSISTSVETTASGAGTTELEHLVMTLETDEETLAAKEL